MIAHTPGPWEMPEHAYVKSDGDGDNFSGGDWCISPPLGESGPVAIVNSEANARLIAAAPDLLAALKAALAEVSEDGVGAVADVLEERGARAIAKAEGRQ